jgi:uncharacterized iron-regulated membrane protein
MSEIIIDIAPDPIRVGAIAAIVLLALGLAVVLVVAFVALLVWRKRRRRTDVAPAMARVGQASSPNQ